MIAVSIIPQAEFDRVRQLAMDAHQRAALIADMCRLNALSAVKRAGSGHLGTSLSAMDIVVWLYETELNTIRLGLGHPDRDIYFSSKGHDVPGLYAALFSWGIIPRERFLRLRRLGGLDGHPDVGVPGIEANSGSLGMGISKGRGMAWAKRFSGRQGRVYVLTGDGEFQEGQNYEALQSAVQQRLHNLTVIMDHNKVQSDKLVSEIMDLGDLEAKIRAFGWHVARVDGHDTRQLEQRLAECRRVTDRPQLLIADTVKGRGISFMEHPEALRAGQGYYRWHAGAPDDASFEAGHAELAARITGRLRAVGAAPAALETAGPEPVARPAAADTLAAEPESKGAAALPVSDEYVAEAFGQALVALGAAHPELVVLDADLSADCRLRPFELAYPDRFIENGIAEQDMVSMAGGLARQGLLPVVNSFANFLAARANEQIYNNACERTKIIYACHYAGLIPAGPGRSHQSVRDISLFGALPGMLIMQPCSAREAELLTAYGVTEAAGSCMIRLNIGPSPRRIALPPDYRVSLGRGAVLEEGTDAVLFGYGPVMLHEALVAREQLLKHGIALKVINMPWLNRVDAAWLRDVTGECDALFVVEDHAPVGGLGDRLQEAFAAEERPRAIRKFAVDGLAACGSPAEALRAHRLDGASLAERVLEAMVVPGKAIS